MLLLFRYMNRLTKTDHLRFKRQTLAYVPRGDNVARTPSLLQNGQSSLRTAQEIASI